jgi:hypothetical protein
MAVAMAMAVAVGSVAVAPTKDASAAKAKSKKVNARVYFAGNAKGTDCLWIAGDGKTAKAVSKNVTLKKGKKTKVTLTIKKPAKYKVGSKSKKLKKVTGATVCTVDLVNVLGSFKKVKCSGITVKADGKKVKVKKVYQGSFEKNKPASKNNWRLSFYNKWGNQGDNSKTNNAKAFAFKKKLTISFTVVAK